MINVKRIFTPVYFDPFGVIADVLAWLNRNHDDYELRGIMGEWTREEARHEIQKGIDCQERNQLSEEAWSGIWHEVV